MARGRAVRNETLMNIVSGRGNAAHERERGRLYTRIEFELEGCGRLFRMSPSALTAILTLSS